MKFFVMTADSEGNPLFINEHLDLTERGYPLSFNIAHETFDKIDDIFFEKNGYRDRRIISVSLVSESGLQVKKKEIDVNFIQGL